MPGRLWHSRQPSLSPMPMLTEAGRRWAVDGVDRPPHCHRTTSRRGRGARADVRASTGGDVSADGAVDLSRTIGE